MELYKSNITQLLFSSFYSFFFFYLPNLDFSTPPVSSLILKYQVNKVDEATSQLQKFKNAAMLDEA